MVIVMCVVVVAGVVIIPVVVWIPVIMISVIVVPVVGLPGIPVNGVIAPVPCRAPDHIGGMINESYHRPGGNVIIGGCDDGHIGPVDRAIVSRIGCLSIIRFNNVVPSV